MNDQRAAPGDDLDPLVREFATRGFTSAEVVGRGGFGTIYRAYQPTLHRHVALKILSPTVDATVRERFSREGAALGRLAGHPNIVEVHAVDVTSAGRPFLVMAFIEGGSLASIITQQGPMPWTEVVRVGVRLCGALETAHRHGIIHRDVKPDNVLVSTYGEPLLADFGIARMVNSFETATPAITASVEHAAPELLDGAPPSVASDVYSLGSTLHQLVTGHAPFERRAEEPLAAWYLRIARQPPPDLTGLDIPAEVARVVGWALEKDPTDRPASAEAFGLALRDAGIDAGVTVVTMALTEVPVLGPLLTVAGGGNIETTDVTLKGTVGTQRQRSTSTSPSLRRGGFAVGIVVLIVLLSAAAWLAHQSTGKAGSETRRVGDISVAGAPTLGRVALVRPLHLSSGGSAEVPFTVVGAQRMMGTVLAAAAPDTPVPIVLLDTNRSPAAETVLSERSVQIDPLAAPSGGRYVLRVGPATSAIDVTVELSLAPDDILASIAFGGAPLHVALAQPRQRAVITLTGAPAKPIRFRWVWSGPDPRYASFNVTGPDGHISWSALTDDLSPPMQPETDGTITVIVTLDADGTGAGDLRVVAA